MLKLALFISILGVFLQNAYLEVKIKFLFNDFFLVCLEEVEEMRSLYGNARVQYFCRKFKNLRNDVQRCRVVDDVRLAENMTYATHISDSCGQNDTGLHPEFANRNDCLITKMKDPTFDLPFHSDGYLSSVSIYCESNNVGNITWECFKVAEATKSENLPSDMVDPISEAAESYYRNKCEADEDSAGDEDPATGGASVNEVFSWTLFLGVLYMTMSLR